MSLDLYFEYIGNKQIQCEHCVHSHTCCNFTELIDSFNITHNLGRMADEVNLYKILWHPDENDISKANQIIEPIKEGLEKLKSDPDYYKQFNAKNGWGTYDNFISFLEKVLLCAMQYPDANIRVWR